MNERLNDKGTSDLNKDPLIVTFSIIMRVCLAGVLLATLYTAWTPTTLLAAPQAEVKSFQKSEGIQELSSSIQNSTPRAQKIGIIAGHWGNDSGAVCADGLKEVEINLAVAALTQKMLVNEGIPVDLLKEKDARLNSYSSSALISIHADSCDYINDAASGFKVAGNNLIETNNRLLPCLYDRYNKITGLKRHPNSITHDMTEYHAFDKVDPETPAAIIEIGFMNLDRQILTQRPDLIAKGVVEGIKCFLYYGEEEPMLEALPSQQP